MAMEYPPCVDFPPGDFPARDPKQCCKERDEEILQVPFVNISVEDRAQDLLDWFSVKAAVARRGSEPDKKLQSVD